VGVEKSIDSELQLRILLIGYLSGISSERKLVEELRMHLAATAQNIKRLVRFLSHPTTPLAPATA
jgi:hypothetical protein